MKYSTVGRCPLLDLANFLSRWTARHFILSKASALKNERLFFADQCSLTNIAWVFSLEYTLCFWCSAGCFSLSSWTLFFTIVKPHNTVLLTGHCKHMIHYVDIAGWDLTVDFVHDSSHDCETILLLCTEFWEKNELPSSWRSPPSTASLFLVLIWSLPNNDSVTGCLLHNIQHPTCPNSGEWWRRTLIHTVSKHTLFVLQFFHQLWVNLCRSVGLFTGAWSSISASDVCSTLVPLNVFLLMDLYGRWAVLVRMKIDDADFSTRVCRSSFWEVFSNSWSCLQSHWNRLSSSSALIWTCTLFTLMLSWYFST